MFKFLFGDNTIAKAVSQVLKQRIARAQKAYNDKVLALEISLDADLKDRIAQHESDKRTHAEVLANSVLGNNTESSVGTKVNITKAE